MSQRSNGAQVETIKQNLKMKKMKNPNKKK
jgi:hypothetical protein